MNDNEDQYQQALQQVQGAIDRNYQNALGNLGATAGLLGPANQLGGLSGNQSYNDQREQAYQRAQSQAQYFGLQQQQIQPTKTPDNADMRELVEFKYKAEAVKLFNEGVSKADFFARYNLELI